MKANPLDDETDGRLIRRFAEGRDERAFAGLVQRHGALVAGVCARRLRNHADADDAFQAVFLVLARKAHALRRHSSIAAWLHQVAVRVCQNERRAGWRRQQQLQEVAKRTREPARIDRLEELKRVIDEELAALPERVREVLILCDLEGHTQNEVARRLSVPVGTVSSRLTRGRAAMRIRLTRQGITVAAGGVSFALAKCAEAAPHVSPELVHVTCHHAQIFVAGTDAMKSTLGTKISALANGALHAMVIAQWKTAACLVAVLATSLFGGALVPRVAPALLGSAFAQATEFEFAPATQLISPNYDGASGPSLSSDGLTLYFTRPTTRDGGLGSFDIWKSTRASTTELFGTATLVPNVNSTYLDSSAAISLDGLSLYLASSRPGGTGDYDMYVATRATANDEFGTPVSLGPDVNSAYEEGNPSISADGLTVYFQSDRPGRIGVYEDIYMATRQNTSGPFGAAVDIGVPINLFDGAGNPSISANGLTLFFAASGKPGGYGGIDLWMSTRTSLNEVWGDPVNLGSNVNGPGDDDFVSFNHDGSGIVFASDRGGTRRLYQSAVVYDQGDTNLDGRVDLEDLNLVRNHFGEGQLGGPRVAGDAYPFDGVVDLGDLNLVLNHFGAGTEGIAAPEPAAASLAGAGTGLLLFGLLLGRRFRR